MFALSALSFSICNSDTPRMMAGEISDGSKWPDMHATATFFFFRLVKSCKTCASGYVCVTSRNASLTRVRTTTRKSTWCFCVCACQLSGCLVMPRSPSTRRHSIGGRRHFSKGALVSRLNKTSDCCPTTCDPLSFGNLLRERIDNMMPRNPTLIAAFA